VFQVGGQTVMGAFLSCAGTSPLHARHADRIFLYVQVDPDLDVPGFGRELFEQNGWSYPSEPVFDWEMKYCDLWLVECSTRTGFLKVPWIR
jgi:hypothetical protein